MLRGRVSTPTSFFSTTASCFFLQEFDASLQSRDPSWGYRDVAEVRIITPLHDACRAGKRSRDHPFAPCVTNKTADNV